MEVLDLENLELYGHMIISTALYSILFIKVIILLYVNSAYMYFSK